VRALDGLLGHGRVGFQSQGQEEEHVSMSKIEVAVVRLNEHHGFSTSQLADLFMMSRPQMRRLLRRAKVKDRKCTERLLNAIFGVGQ
jgi:predicted DNA-binding protein (UPF0251 family)